MSNRTPAVHGTERDGSPAFSRRTRIRYVFDEYMSRGTIALVVALFVATILVVLVATAVIWVAGWAGEEIGPVGVFWRAMLATFDPAIVGGEEGNPAFLITLLVVTFAGIFITSILIGILTTGIEGRLAELRKGRSIVVAEGHAVILGWSQQIYTVVEELLASGELGRKPQVVVLAERDKVEMQDDITARVPAARRGMVVCRTGTALEPADLRLASIDTAKSIVMLSGPAQHADSGLIKSILAIVNNPQRRRNPYHIVAEVRRSANLPAAEIAGGSEAQLVVVDELVARIIAQTCRQSGLSAVYEQLLNFEGDEIYFVTAEPLAGLTYGDALARFETATVIGIQAGGAVTLGPAMETKLGVNDQVVVIAKDGRFVRHAAAPVGVVDEQAIVAGARVGPSPERTLILDWNRRAASIVQELDRYMAAGSHIVIGAADGVPDAALASLRKRLTCTVEVRQADPAAREQLDALCAEGFDHLIVLSLDDLDPQLADARTLITLLHLREIEARHHYDFSITSEMVDLRNRALAQVTHADDFIVSDRIASLLLSQLAQDAALKAVFDDLFNPEGAEIYLRPASDYVRPDRVVSFATLIESARRRGETPLGYRVAVAADDASRNFGVVLNPDRSAEFRLDAADRVIVLASEG